jgi:hypothetical protein
MRQTGYNPYVPPGYCSGIAALLRLFYSENRQGIKSEAELLHGFGRFRAKITPTLDPKNSQTGEVTKIEQNGNRAAKQAGEVNACPSKFT